MIFKELSMGFSKKVSDNNYGSYEVHVGATVSLGEHDTPSKITKQLAPFLRIELLDQLEVMKRGGR